MLPFNELVLVIEMYLHPFRVFISYPEKDEWFMGRIYNLLTLMEIEVLVSEHAKRGGDELWNKIQSHIDISDCVLVLYTTNAPMSKWVHREISIAKTLGKVLIPVWEKHVDLPEPLRGEEKEWIEFRRENPIVMLEEIGFHLADRRSRTPHAYFLTEGSRYKPAMKRLVLIPATGKAYWMGKQTNELVAEGKIQFTSCPEIGRILGRSLTEDLWAFILGFNVIKEYPTLKELGFR